MNNPGYIDSQQRERHRVIDQAIADSHEALHIPAIAQLLGERAVQLTQILNQLTIPNLHHNVVQPNHGGSDQIDIVALYNSERVQRRFVDMAFNSIQENRIHQTEPFIAQQIIDTQASYYDCEDTFPVFSFDDLPQAAAHVSNGELPRHTAEGVLHLRGRPLVILNADRPADRHPAFVLHELTHVQQLHRKPVIIPHYNLATLHAEHEIEAYHVTAQVIRGQQQSPSRLPQLSAPTAAELLHIDELRAHNQKSRKRPFRINKSLLRQLAASNHTIV